MNKLALAAAELNRKSDELNAIIDDFEEALENANVGVGVLLEKPLATETLKLASANISSFLGYAKINGRWRLCVTRALLDECGKIIKMEEPAPLQNAPRLVRLEAVRVFDDLATALSLKMTQYSEAIRAATVKRRA
ncbi:MAG TPA: hypothetical protein VG734_25680 [Lacunisphaera sp.]|nr:hypothetical protein [Lacunisphaera sp.]